MAQSSQRRFLGHILLIYILLSYINNPAINVGFSEYRMAAATGGGVINP